MQEDRDRLDVVCDWSARFRSLLINSTELAPCVHGPCTHGANSVHAAWMDCRARCSQQEVMFLFIL